MLKEEKQVYSREDIAERIERQINQMGRKELIDFCIANFGGVNHGYNELTDEVSFDLE